MDAKVTITNICGAKCATCPNWHEKPRTMSFEKFCKLWDILNASPEISRILINNVGDVYELPNAKDYLEKIEDRKKPVIITTNANTLTYIPKIDSVIISFNGGDKETYEKTTGLNYEKVVSNIRRAYPELAKLKYTEIDCLMWCGNKGIEDEVRRLWGDYPGRVRISYKVENQGKEYFGITDFKDEKRIPCDYLGILSIAPSGKIISCAHDFGETTDLGNIFDMSVPELLNNPARLKMIKEHNEGVYLGLCEKCNYNVKISGKIFFLK